MTLEKAGELSYNLMRALNQTLQGREMPPWDDASKETHSLHIAGVFHASRGLTAKELHAFWEGYMKDCGWTFGPTLNVVSKSHPCLIPFEQLPPIERYKDEIFVVLGKMVKADVHSV